MKQSLHCILVSIVFISKYVISIQYGFVGKDFESEEINSENICLLLSLRSLENVSFIENYIESEYLVNSTLDNEYVLSTILCIPENEYKTINNSCFHLKPVQSNMSSVILKDILTSFVPQFSDELVVIEDWLQPPYSRCYHTELISCEPAINKLSARVMIIEPNHKDKIETLNSFLDGYYESFYFSSDSGILCKIFYWIYISLDCLQNVSIIFPSVDILDVPRSRRKEVSIRDINDTFACLPTKAFRIKVPHEFPLPRRQLLLLSYGISLGVFVFHVIFALFWENGLDYPRNVFLCLAISLAIEMAFAIMQSYIKGSMEICFTIYFFQRFGALSSFLWIGTIGFDLWNKFRAHEGIHIRLTKKEKIIRVLKYSIFTWIASIVIVATDILVMLFSHPESLFHHVYYYPLCLFWQRHSSIVFYQVPMIIVLILNCYFFITTMYTIRKTKKMLAERLDPTCTFVFDQMAIFWKMFILMGIHWIFIVVADITNIEILNYIDIVFTSLQIILLFVLFTVKPCIRKCRLKGAQFKRQLTNSSTSSTNISARRVTTVNDTTILNKYLKKT